MKKIHIIKILIFVLVLNSTFLAFSDEPKYDIKSSEERITYLVSLIEKNLEGCSVLYTFQEEQKAWELYKKMHIEMLFPKKIDNVKMLWGSVSKDEISKEILILNIERIKILEAYLARDAESGTDGRGDFKEYVDELKRIKH